MNQPVQQPDIQNQTEHFPIMTAQDRIARGISLPSPVVGDLLFGGTIAALGAPEDSFKTNWTVQLAICLAVGSSCYSYSCRKSQVAYLVLEGGEDYILERIEEKIDAMGVNREEALRGIYTLDCSQLQLDNEDTIEKLEDTLCDLNPKPSVVIFDPITYALDEDVRYSPSKTRLIRNANRIVEELDNGVVLLVIHTRKGARDNADMDDFLGSGQIARAAATRIKLYRGDGDRVSMYAKTRHAERPDKISLVWRHPLLVIEPITLRPREECKAAIIQALENAPHNLKAMVLGVLVTQVSRSANRNPKTVRSTITDLVVEGKVEILRVPGSAAKIVRLVD